jgi:tetratricopeptide (TPR) repeat protein
MPSAVAAVAGVLLLAAVAAAAPADEARALLEQLGGGTAAERRAAAARLGEIGDGAAIGGLERALRDQDAAVRALAQASLWAIWHRSGDAAIDALLQRGIAAMEARRFPEAVALFDEVIRRAPAFAEGWNKRATVYYLMGEWDKSLADCEEVVRRNPIHFGALSGFGLNYVQKGDLTRAAAYFERALRVNPNLESIESLLEEIREALQKEGGVRL